MLLKMKLQRFLFSFAILCSVVLAEKWVPAPNTPWQWQLGAPIDTTYPAIVFVIDLIDAPEADLQRLKRMGRRIVCDFGTASAKVPDINSVSSVISYARLRGCDAILPPSLSKFSQFNENLDLQVAYSKAIAKASQSQSISIGLNDDLASIPYLVSNFDFLLIVDCMSKEDCEKAELFNQAGKAVFHAELEHINMVPPQMTCRKVPAIYNTLFKEYSLGPLSYTCSDFGIWSSPPVGPRHQDALLQDVNSAMLSPLNRRHILKAKTSYSQPDIHPRVNLPRINEPGSNLDLQSADRQIPMQTVMRSDGKTVISNQQVNESPSPRNGRTGYQLSAVEQSEFSKLLSQATFAKLNAYQDFNPFVYDHDAYDIDLPDEMPTRTNHKPPRWPTHARSNTDNQLIPTYKDLQPQRPELTTVESSANGQPLERTELSTFKNWQNELQRQEARTPKQVHLQVIPKNGHLHVTRQTNGRWYYPKDTENLRNELTVKSHLNNIEAMKQQHLKHTNNHINKQKFDSKELLDLMSTLIKQIKTSTNENKDGQSFNPKKITATDAIVFNTTATDPERTKNLTNATRKNIVHTTTAKTWTNITLSKNTSDSESIISNTTKEDRSINIGTFQGNSHNSSGLSLTAVGDGAKTRASQVLHERRTNASYENTNLPNSISGKSSTETGNETTSVREREILYLPNEEFNILLGKETSTQIVHSKNVDSFSALTNANKSLESARELPVPIRHLDFEVDFIGLTPTPDVNREG